MFNKILLMALPLSIISLLAIGTVVDPNLENATGLIIILNAFLQALILGKVLFEA